MGTTFWEAALTARVSGEALALVTTLHCALAVLLRHRCRRESGGASLVAPSVGFVVSPWILPAPAWLVAALAAHFGWLAACERLVFRRAAEPAGAAPPVRQGAARSARPEPPPTGRPGGATRFASLTVLDVLVETAEIRTFRLARPAGFAFRAGQFVMVRVELDGERLVRCYSISSSPSVPGWFEISVRRQGRVSGYLHATVRPGAVLEIRGPQGTFVHPDGDRPILLLAGGIGITPLLSMARHAIEAEPARRVTLVLAAKTEAHVPFRAEIQQLARRHPSFRFVIALSRGRGEGCYPGRIDSRLIETVAPEARESVCLLCGPLPMIEGAVAMLRELGVPGDRIRFEQFEGAPASASAAVDAAPPEGTAARRSVRLQRRNKVVCARQGQSILDAVEGAGEQMSSSCRAGVCGTCRTRVLEGEVEGEFDAIDDGDRARGFVLACVARPVTDCVIDA